MDSVCMGMYGRAHVVLGQFMRRGRGLFKGVNYEKTY